MGTDKLVSVIDGTYWVDGSQASEQVLNFLMTGVNSMPTTLPRDYGRFRVRKQERETLAAIRALAGNVASTNAQIRAALANIRTSQYSAIRDRFGRYVERVMLDHFGNPVPAGAKLVPSSVAQVPPIITGISGEAVEKGIIYPAQYGSPDFLSGGWYWSATVATHTPRVWSYTLHVLLYRLVQDAGKEPVWEPVPMTCESRLNITNKPMRNGFTGGGTGFLPVGPCQPVAQWRIGK